jgi:myo-inositol-1(or 4)-monophosphatase
VGLVKNLATGDVYEAEKGKGAKLNGKNISTTRDEKLEGASLCVYIHRDVRRLEKLLKMPKRVRTLGCVALEMCHVAKGDYHAMVDLRKVLRVTDIAAGKLIVEEAGGIVSDGLGQPLRASILEIERTSPIASGNIGIHKKILNVLR